MINCAHPTHFSSVLTDGDPWVTRIRGLRANASRLSHAELDEAAEPDAGEPEELGREYAELKRRLPQLTVLGGCCGTDQRHIGHIATTRRSSPMAGEEASRLGAGAGPADVSALGR